jgi:hypothetical protein
MNGDVRDTSDALARRPAACDHRPASITLSRVRMTSSRRTLACGALLLLTPLGAGAQPGARRALSGIRFGIDTVESPASWRGALTRIAGTIEVANGHGRLSVTAIRSGPPVRVNGVVIGAPLAKPGDYYLFDSTEVVLVRPKQRTFSRFVLTRADYNQTGRLLPGAFMMRYTPCSTDTLSVQERVTQHAPISVHWHLDTLDEQGPTRLYARGWLEVLDAPASEAGAIRWFGVAMAMASRPGGIATLPRSRLQLTAMALLRATQAREPYLRYLALLRPVGLTTAELEPSRLTLPKGYTEMGWPGITPRRRASARALRGGNG